MAQAVFTAGKTREWSAPRWRPRQATLLAFALLAPSLLFLALFTYWPVLQVLWQSVHGQLRVGGPQAYVGPLNFIKLFADPAFRKALGNNLIYALGTVIPSLVLALGFAMALVRSSRVNALFRALFFLPVLIPLVAAASIFLFLFLPNVGLLDYHLAKLAISGTNWLGDPDIALWSIMALTIWKNAGYYMLFFLAGLQAVPADAYEAAILDGAGPWRRFWSIQFPLLSPTTFFLLVINVVYAFFDTFAIVDTATQGGPGRSTSILVYKVYYDGFKAMDLGGSAAQSVVLMLIVVALTVVQFRYVEKKVNY